MKAIHICAALAALSLAACGVASADQSAAAGNAEDAAKITQTTSTEAKVCYSNSTGQVVYMEIREQDGEPTGFQFQPGSICSHRSEPLDVTVWQEAGGENICSATILPNQTLDLTKDNGLVECSLDPLKPAAVERATDEPTYGSMSWQNKTDRELYFEVLLRNIRSDGRIIEPDAFYFTSNLEVLEFRVRHNADDAVICTGPVEPDTIHQLMSVDGAGQCVWQVSE